MWSMQPKSRRRQGHMRSKEKKKEERKSTLVIVVNQENSALKDTFSHLRGKPTFSDVLLKD